MIDKREVEVDMFYPYLSQTSTGARYQPVTIPQDIVIKLDDTKSKFIRHSDKFRAQLESDLTAGHCQVQWPDHDDNGQLTLHCTVSTQAADAPEQVHDWTNKCHAIATHHLANITSVTERVSGEIWTKFLQEIKSDDQTELRKLYVEEDGNSFSLLCVGMSDTVGVFHDVAVTVSKRLMEELATAKSKKFEVITNLTTAQLQIIKTSRFWETTATSVEVTFDGHGMSLQGSETEIMAIKVKMYEQVVNQIQNKVFPCDQFKLKLLNKPDIMQYFQSIFEQKQLNVAWTMTANDLTVHGLHDAGISEAGSTISRELSEKKVQLDSSSSAALNLPQWKSVESMLTKNSKVLEIFVAADKMSVTCCGIHDQVEAAEAEIDKFFRQNTVVEKFIKSPEGKVIFIRKHLNTEVDNITASLQNDAIKLEMIEDGDKSGFVIRGTRHGLERATPQVVELLEDILEVVHDSDLPGTHKYFATKRGKDSLIALENRSKVVVVVSEEELSREDNDGGASWAAASAPVVKSEVCAGQSGTMIRVIKGYITECHADALIVTISDDLKHTDGAAKLIAAAGTPLTGILGLSALWKLLSK